VARLARLGRLGGLLRQPWKFGLREATGARGPRAARLSAGWLAAWLAG